MIKWMPVHLTDQEGRQAMLGWGVSNNEQKTDDYSLVLVDFGMFMGTKGLWKPNGKKAPVWDM